MGAVHSKRSFVSVDGDDISVMTKNVQFGRKRDTHDNTGFGVDDKTYNSGLGDGTVTMSGDYFDDVAGPAAVISPIYAAGTAVELVYRVAGVGTGKPHKSVSAICAAYNESSAVAGNVQWTAEWQMTGPVTETPQA